jgi:hypothetical protein
MGFDTFDIQDLIEEKGIWENSIELILKAKQDPIYTNVLKIPRALPQYGYGGPPQNQFSSMP